MRKTFFASVLLSCLVLAGHSETAWADELLPLDSQRAHLYVMHPVVGASERGVGVSVNGKQAAYLDFNQYQVISLPPGQHQLELAVGDKTLTKQLSIGPGQGAYIFVEVENTSIDVTLGIQELSRETAGKYLIRSDSAAARPLVLDAPGAPLPVVAEPVPVAAPVVAATATPAAGVAGMPSGISMVTLGVDSLERAVRFYTEGLGLTLSSHSSREIAFFELSGSWLALYPRAALAEDAGVAVGKAEGFPGITLAHNVADKETVDRVMKAAAAAGAEIVKPAHEAFWGGYSGYFKDPDGFYWEVAWNPLLPLAR